MNSLIKAGCVVAGGGLGAYLRYLVQSAVQWKPGLSFPWGTLIINLSGAFVIGTVMTAFAEHFKVSPEWRLFLVVGVLGGYTTFSSLAWESYELVSSGNAAQAGAYVLVSAVGGALAVVGGVWLGKWI